MARRLSSSPLARVERIQQLVHDLRLELERGHEGGLGTQAIAAAVQREIAAVVRRLERRSPGSPDAT